MKTSHVQLMAIGPIGQNGVIVVLPVGMVIEIDQGIAIHPSPHTEVLNVMVRPGKYRRVLWTHVSLMVAGVGGHHGYAALHHVKVDSRSVSVHVQNQHLITGETTVGQKILNFKNVIPTNAR